MVPDELTKLDLIQARLSFIPMNWRLCKIADVLHIKNSFRKPISQEEREKIKGIYPYYGPTKIQDRISTYEQDGNYALIGEDGDHFLKYKEMEQTQLVTGKCTVNNHAHIIESGESCDSEWFYTFFQHRDITNFLSRQGAGRFKLNKATLEKLPILVPPLAEQKKIAKILQTWDRAIATTEKLIDASKQQKKALMQQLLTGKKRFPGFEGEWATGSLGTIADVKSGGTPSRKNDSYWNGEIPWVTTTEVKFGTIKATAQSITTQGLENSSAKVFPTGTILIAMYGQGKTRGQVAKLGMNASTNQACAALLLKKQYDVDFYYYYLMSQYENIRDMSNEGGQKNLSAGIIKNIVVPIPSMAEQQKISEALKTLIQENETLLIKLNFLKQEKKALMQQLLTGKRRVKIDA